MFKRKEIKYGYIEEEYQDEVSDTTVTVKGNKIEIPCSTVHPGYYAGYMYIRQFKDKTSYVKEFLFKTEDVEKIVTIGNYAITRILLKYREVKK